MSTYAVFGMTRPQARVIAKRAVDKMIRKKKDCTPESDWLKLVDAEEIRIMESSQTVMLSDKFDAPQFVQDYRNLAARIESRDLHIKAWCKTGEKLKSGRPKMHWVPAH